MYEYRAEIVRVIDGDTVVAKIDLGFRIHVEQTLRLYGIDAPEKRGQDRTKGLAATEFLTTLLRGLKDITVLTRKDRTGKYGRVLAKLRGTRESGRVVNINQEMVTSGHAVWYGD